MINMQDVPTCGAHPGGIGTHGPVGPIRQTLKEHAGGKSQVFSSFPMSFLTSRNHLHLTRSTLRPAGRFESGVCRQHGVAVHKVIRSGSLERRARYLVRYERDPARERRICRMYDPTIS